MRDKTGETPLFMASVPRNDANHTRVDTASARTARRLVWMTAALHSQEQAWVKAWR